MNEYFFETEKYKEGKEIFERFGFVVWTGRSGSGKSLASVHLLLDERYRESLVIRVRTVKELKDMRKDKNSGNTILFIDEIFNSVTTDNDLEELFSEMEKIFDDIKNYQCIITSEPRELERACESMGYVTPLLNENCRVNIDNPNNNEKKNIMEQYASIKDKESIPGLLKEIKGNERFPILSFLYFRNEKCRNRGPSFFSNPKKYLLTQIEEEIEKEKRVKTLLFCLFFHEWSIRNKNLEDTPLQIQSKDECEKVLGNIPQEFYKEFEPFTYEGLEDVAQPFVHLYLIHKCKQNGYKFFHNIVYEVVGSWIFDPKQSHGNVVKFFLLELIEHEVEIPTESKHLADAFCGALHEKNKYKLCRLENFQDICEKMIFWEGEEIMNFLKNPRKNPLMYRTGYHKLHSLAETLYDISVKKDLDPEYQLVISLFGECASSSKGLTINRTDKIQKQTDTIKEEVLKFKDSNDNNILHLVVSSDRSDKFAATAIDLFLQSEMVNARNKNRMTPLMLAVQRKERKVVIEKLMSVSPSLICMSTTKQSVFHLCVKSFIDDETCAEYLKVILSSEGNKNMLNKPDGDGNTPLMLAAKQSAYSRIWSISTILDQRDITINAVDKEEKYPFEMSVSCLENNAEYVRKELCIRKIIFNKYGHCSNTDESHRIEHELEKELNAFQITETYQGNVPDSFLPKLNNETRRRIMQCVQDLKNFCLNKAYK